MRHHLITETIIWPSKHSSDYLSHYLTILGNHVMTRIIIKPSEPSFDHLNHHSIFWDIIWPPEIPSDLWDTIWPSEPSYEHLSQHLTIWAIIWLWTLVRSNCWSLYVLLWPSALKSLFFQLINLECLILFSYRALTFFVSFVCWHTFASIDNFSFPLIPLTTSLFSQARSRNLLHPSIHCKATLFQNCIL